MYAFDFEYDKLRLSDFGYIVCTFGGESGTETIDIGSTLKFNTVTHFGGNRRSLTSTEYEDCITSTFSICKDPKKNRNMEIDEGDCRKLSRWLSRKRFLKFRPLYDGYDLEEDKDCYYNASFNVEKIYINHVLLGLTLTMETDSPFGYGRNHKIIWYINGIQSANINISQYSSSGSTGSNFILVNKSDEIGNIYPKVSITFLQNGNFEMVNKTAGTTTSIKNVSEGETITLDGYILQIFTDNDLHADSLHNDFNYEYPVLVNTFRNRKNVFTFSLPCIVEIQYIPYVKNFI